MCRQGKIVYSFEELKKLWPKEGKKGYWCFHANFHDGHKRTAEAAQHCDCVVGILFNNMAEGEHLLLGNTFLQTYPISAHDLGALKKYSDICVILKDDYQPMKYYLDEIKTEFEENFPVECLIEKQLLNDQVAFNALYYAIAYRYILHGIYNIFFDYQAQGGKDRFRVVGYLDYLKDRWGVEIDLLDPVIDEYGNSISKTIDGMPQELKNRINKKLLLPEFTTIEEVQEHIETIEGLKALTFYKSREWVHATFAFENYRPWTEGVRWK